MRQFFAAFGAAFLGYVVIVVLSVACIAATWFTVGADFAFAPHSNLASVGWCLAILSGGFVAAVAGGAVTTWLSPRGSLSAISLLAGAIMFLGVFTVVMQAVMPDMPLPEGKTMADLSFAEAGQFARSPMWYNIANVIVGFGGVLLGHRLARKNVPLAN